jgi:hypothetical protein
MDYMIKAWDDARACSRMFLPGDVWASLPGPIEWPAVISNYETAQSWVATDLRTRLLTLDEKFTGNRQSDKASDTTEPMVTAADVAQPDGTKPQRPCYLRDQAFLKWYEADGTSTYRSHAGIVTKWNSLNREQREAIARNCTSNVNRASVVKAVDKAREERKKR